MRSCLNCKNRNTDKCIKCIGWNQFELICGSELKSNFDDISKELLLLKNHFISKQKEQTLPFDIKKVIFSCPATVVIWKDGTKTIVKAGDHDVFDPEKGLAMAIAKKALGNQGNYYEIFKKYLPEEGEFKELTESLKQMIDDKIYAIKEIERYEENYETEDEDDIQWLTTNELSDKNGVTIKYLRKEIKNGFIPQAKKVKGKWMIPCRVFDDHAEIVAM